MSHQDAAEGAHKRITSFLGFGGIPLSVENGLQPEAPEAEGLFGMRLHQSKQMSTGVMVRTEQWAQMQVSPEEKLRGLASEGSGKRRKAA